MFNNIWRHTFQALWLLELGIQWDMFKTGGFYLFIWILWAFIIYLLLFGLAEFISTLDFCYQLQNDTFLDWLKFQLNTEIYWFFFFFWSNIFFSRQTDYKLLFKDFRNIFIIQHWRFRKNDYDLDSNCVFLKMSSENRSPIADIFRTADPTTLI